ncbi:MAG TPA: hypothetical protein VN731_10360 [Rhodanobacter sp.]|nr:hypothetical protein [Rhodanobacter sp.]
MTTVKVRIAVAVDAKGRWNSCGWDGAKSDADKMDLCVETLAGGEARYWLDAELALPSEAIAVQPSVTAA